MTRRLEGRLALVTGASSGIGKATALALADEGARLVLTARRERELQQVARSCIAAGAEARAVPGDLTDARFVEALAAESASADILVNNAAILAYAPLLETTVAECEAMFRTNVLAAFAVALALGTCMAQRRRGHMVFVTSLAARNVHALGVAYAATKHALSAFAKGFRLELKPAGVRVTEIAPGMVDTPLRKSITHPAVREYFATRPFKPLAPRDVANAVVYALTSSDECCNDLIELRPTGA